MTQASVCQSQSKLHSVHLLFLQGSWASNQIKKRGGLTRPQRLEEVAGKEGDDFFPGRGVHLSYNKLKSEISNDKKSYKQKYFSLW